MTDCIFCKIVAGTVPSRQIYADDQFIAFLDINPLSAGHTLVIPKTHHRYVWDVENISGYFAVVQKVAKALQKVSGTEEVHMKVVGEEVHHAHVWVYANPNDTHGDKWNFEENAQSLRTTLAEGGNAG